MGTIRQGANGGFSGKAGSVVGSSWKDISYIKGLSKRRTGGPSQLQLEAQARFGTAITFLKPIKDLLNFTYGSMKAGRATGFNMALKQVIKTGVQGTYPDYAINYPAVNLAVGSLAIATGSVTAGTNISLKVMWDPDTNPHNGFADDSVTVLIYDPETNIYKNGPGNLNRADGQSVIELRPEMIGKAVHVYYFFTSRDGKKLSPSYYAGTATLQE
jgi:hypothetical protein